MLAPVGVFQPSADEPWNVGNDLDLWRATVRELAEELLGTAEDYGSDRAPIDYDGWPFFRELAAARADGSLRVHWLGLGVDPLTLAVDIMLVAVFDAELFDRLFAGLVAANEEGSLVTGCPFTAEEIDVLTGRRPMQPAGSALLRLAWAHRDTLLG